VTTAIDNLATVLAMSGAEGLRPWSDGERIHYRSPNPISQTLRDAILANKPALIAHLTLWDAQEAIRLECAADGAVETSGVSGSEPGVLALAAACVAAHHQNDMTGVRSNCALIENRVRQMANARRNAA
jgi:hypothetical protein